MTVLSRKAKIAIIAVFCSLILFFAVGGTLVWAQTYDGRMGPNTFIGSVEVSGMDPEEAMRVLREATDVFYASGAPVILDGKPASIPLSTLVGSDSIDTVRFQVEETVQNAFGRTHGEDGAVDTLRLLEELFRPNRVGMFVSADEEKIREAVRAAFPDREVPPVDAAFAFKNDGGWTAEVTEGTPGDAFDFEPFLTTLLSRLADLDRTPTPLIVTHRDPDVSTENAEALVERALAAIGRAPFAITVAADDTTDGGTWTFDVDALSLLLAPGTEGLAVNEEAFAATLDEIAAAVETPARDARFLMENGRVVEFVGSQDGVTLDRDAARAGFEAALNGDATDVALTLVVAEPSVKTEDVNDLGITEVLGVGTSSYRGSPPNRIKNIRNGVRLLNGLLIPPGETFSLLNALRPFELANGYLPELVIKGDKIEPEIAGGLCQIGTTTFRAVMNSGLPVTKRSNHSLVVSYYNDPSNGNPGTDATIYDPAPDFQFTNDTEHYVLFQAEMDEAEMGLRFTFWGTSDGRKGSYSPPVVLRWIGVGETVNTETLDLAPGEKKCQGAHVGADTTFTYSVVKPDGTTEETVFASHYRPLPEICLVGVEELSTPDDLQPDADSVSSSQTTDAPVEADDALQPDLETETE